MLRRHPFARRIRTHDSGVAVTAEVDNAVTTVTVRGSWGRALSRDAFLALKRSLSGHPDAVIIDLCDLDDPHAASALTWITARRVADAMEPPVHVVACVPPGGVLADRLERLGAAYFLPTYPSHGLARAAVAAGRPLTDQRRLALPPEPDTPALARNLVTDACAAWRVPGGVLYPARLVMSELAGNAVEHARTPIVVVVLRRDDGLHLVVNDRDPRLPTLLPIPKEPPGDLWNTRGQGLRTVQAASAAWGALPTAEGKMVWATVFPS
ncbi:ATP-binding protein [Actinoplanes sp. NPDC049596]|uniref:ATP-binding protein n=1 Tax=unclassified Actinoplanes TaxID=2626549 RepID=UPI0034416604